MYSDHRQGVKNLLTPEESKKSLELAANAWKTRSTLAPKIGKGKYVLAKYEQIKRITIEAWGYIPERLSKYFGIVANKSSVIASVVIPSSKSLVQIF